MAFEYRDKDQLVDDVLAAIQNNLSFEIDTSSGEPLRTIVEAIMQEMHLQYWQLDQVYDASFIDSAYGTDLSELVKILGIEREPSKRAEGFITFKRETIANLDYYIPSGTLIQTLPNQEGIQFQYQTTVDSMLVAGQLSVDVPIRAVTPGEASNVVAGTIIVINDPPQGIESVINTEAIVGGIEEETDENLRERAKKVLDTVGLGTIKAIENKIEEIDNIRQVSVLDMERGIGTVDILILGDIIPLPQNKIEEIEKVIELVKAAGIDVKFSEPALISLDITIEVIVKEGFALDEELITKIEDAINDYVNNLSIGERLIKNQLERHILNSSESIVDLIVSSPADSVYPDPKEVIRVNNISLTQG